MRCVRTGTALSRWRRIAMFACLAIMFSVVPGRAQSERDIAPLPLVTGYGAFIAGFEPGKQVLNPVLAPILLVPLRNRALIEAEFEMESDLEREGGEWGPRTLEKGIEYLQVDYFAHPNVTLVGGRFLLPFGLYNERLHPAWIKNLTTTPLIFGLSAGSGTGGMVRGGVPVNQNATFNYAAYFSGESTRELVESERTAGGRWGVFFSGPRVEGGFSFKRNLGDERFNSTGVDFTWNATTVPLDLRLEYARGDHQSGYWVEGAYRLTNVQVWPAFFSRSQIVVRMEQFFAPDLIDEHDEEEIEDGHSELVPEAEEGHGVLPEVDTRRPMIGWNYYIRDGFKVGVAFGRVLTQDGGHNTWSMAVAYRFGY